MLATESKKLICNKITQQNSKLGSIGASGKIPSRIRLSLGVGLRDAEREPRVGKASSVARRDRAENACWRNVCRHFGNFPAPTMRGRCR